MINYTTPSITLEVEAVDLTDNDVYVTLHQGNYRMTKKGTDLVISTETHEQITDTVITFVLTQEESASFVYDKKVSVQVNWINASGVRDATEVKTIGVMRNLLDEVIAYGD